MDTTPIIALTDAEAWDFLAGRSFGRLALSLAGQPEIFPVNFAVVQTGQVVFRTGEGTKLLGVLMNSRVALETDLVEDGGATSVVVKGSAREVEGSHERETMESSGLRSWVPTLKHHVVVIEVDEISGRRVVFGPEPDLTPVM